MMSEWPESRPGGSALARVIALTALVAALLALVISLLVLIGGLRARSAAVASLDNIVAQVEDVCGPNAEPIVFPISQTVRFSGDIALPSGIVIPFQGDIPIDTSFELRTFDGGPVITIPIRTTVPVDTEVPLPAGVTIPVDADVPLQQDIPVDLCAGQARLLLEDMLESLRDLQAGL